MAEIKQRSTKLGQFGGFSPFGNLAILAFGMATDATGIVKNSDATAAAAISDVIDLGPLEEGLRLDDASIFVQDAFGTGVKADLGFKYADGVNLTGTQAQDAAYFGAGFDLATVGRLRATGSKLITLPKPARLILTVKGAAIAEAGKLAITVQGELVGPQ